MTPQQAEQLERLVANPPERAWNGLARDIVMWLQLSHVRNTGWTLHEHLRAVGRNIPSWLSVEIPPDNSVPSKGTIAVVIFRAMFIDTMKELNDEKAS